MENSSSKLPDEIERTSKAFLEKRQFRNAVRPLWTLRRYKSHELKAYVNLGAALYNLERYASAKIALTRAVAIDPSNTTAHLNLANTLCRLGNQKEAEIHFELILKSNSNNPLILSNYAMFLHHSGRSAEAISILQKIISEHPTFSLSYLHLGLVLKDKSFSDAIGPLKKAYMLDQHHPDLSFAFGQCLWAQHQHDEALAFLKKASEQRPDSIERYIALGNAYLTLSFTEEAIYTYETALKIEPNNLCALLGYHLATPVIPLTRREIHAYYSRCLHGLIQTRRRTLKHSAQPIIPYLFYFAYHDSSIKPILKAFYNLLHPIYCARETLRILPKSESSESKEASASHVRIRIGFASHYFSYHSNSRAFEGLIKHINKTIFEVFIIHGPSSNEDAVRERIDSYADKTLVISGGATSLKEIEELNLDILFFTDLGMDMFMATVAMNRVAPIQMTGWGIPHTSGIRNIDIYISSSIAEPPGAEQHYTENLVKLPSLPCCYLSDQLVLHELPREYFMLPPDSPVFGCLQSLYKLHPDFDWALEQLAIRNPAAAFVLVENPSHHLTARYLQRIEKSAPHFKDQLVFLALMGREQFIALSNVVDVLLDPFHYCSGISFYESSFAGTPTVTMEGRFLRSRLVAAAYRYIGISKPPIASTPEEYVEIASHLIQNPAELKALTKELREKARSLLYDDLTYVRSFEEFCIDAVARETREADPIT